MENNITQWWYELNGQQNGPVMKEEIQDFIKMGNLKRNNLVWKEGWERWIAISETEFKAHSGNNTLIRGIIITLTVLVNCGFMLLICKCSFNIIQLSVLTVLDLILSFTGFGLVVLMEHFTRQEMQR